MWNFNEIKEFVVNFQKSELTTAELERTLVEILTQLGYTEKSCGCKSQLPRLYQKLASWLRNHTSLCHYKIDTGVLLFLDGQAVTNTILTDEIAERLLADGDNAKHIKQILPFEEKTEQSGTNTNQEQESPSEGKETLSTEELNAIATTKKAITKKENKKRVKK